MHGEYNVKFLWNICICRSFGSLSAIQTTERRITIYNKVKRMRKAVAENLKVIFWLLPGGTL
jgi:hypothetical protein